MKKFAELLLICLEWIAFLGGFIFGVLLISAWITGGISFSLTH